MKIIISTDSCCDVPSAELKEMDVHNILMPCIINGETTYPDFSTDQDYKEFFESIQKGTMPTTTQLNSYELEIYFEKLLKENEGDLLHFSLSSGLSGTYDNAVAAAEAVMAKLPDRKVYILDSLAGSYGQAMLVDLAVDLRKKGHAFDKIIAILEEIKHKLQQWFFVDDLRHLKRGGRISSFSAIVGTVVHLKPVLTCNEKGQIKVVHKCFGMQKVLKLIAESIEKYGVGDTITIQGEPIEVKLYIAHGCAEESVINNLVEKIREVYKGDIKIAHFGPIIGTHTGPGSAAIFFFGQDRVKAR